MLLFVLEIDAIQYGKGVLATLIRCANYQNLLYINSACNNVRNIRFYIISVIYNFFVAVIIGYAHSLQLLIVLVLTVYMVQNLLHMHFHYWSIERAQNLFFYLTYTHKFLIHFSNVSYETLLKWISRGVAFFVGIIMTF